jgi:hypothetical protein
MFNRNPELRVANVVSGKAEHATHKLVEETLPLLWVQQIVGYAGFFSSQRLQSGKEGLQAGPPTFLSILGLAYGKLIRHHGRGLARSRLAFPTSGAGYAQCAPGAGRIPGNAKMGFIDQLYSDQLFTDPPDNSRI